MGSGEVDRARSRMAKCYQRSATPTKVQARRGPMLKGSREAYIAAQKAVDMVSRKSEVCYRGHRQFAGDGRRKLAEKGRSMCPKSKANDERIPKDS